MKRTILLYFFLFLVRLSVAQNDSSFNKKFSPELINFFANKQVEIDTTLPAALYQVSYDWMGTRYCYSGHSEKGIDCSGFTKVIYSKAFSDTLSGGSADIASKVQLVPQSELKVGDMVFFRIKRKRVSHVGVYLGNNKFVHAAIKGGVQVNDLSEPYYKRYFYKGGRSEKRLSIQP